jgi:hypothetical protein
VALFPVVKRQNEAVALGFVTARMLEAAIILIGVASLLAVETLRQDLAGAAGTDTASLVTTGRSLVALRDWTFLLGPSLMPGISALLLGSLLYRSGAVAWRLAGRQGLQAVPDHRWHDGAEGCGLENVPAASLGAGRARTPSISTRASTTSGTCCRARPAPATPPDRAARSSGHGCRKGRC